MTRKTNAAELVAGAVRQISSMRQNAEALADGEITTADIERMAVERVARQLGEEAVRQEDEVGVVLPRLEYLNTYGVEADRPLFASEFEDGEAARLGDRTDTVTVDRESTWRSRWIGQSTMSVPTPDRVRSALRRENGWMMRDIAR